MNRVLRKMFWSKRDEVTGKWRRLQSESSFVCNSHQLLIDTIKNDMGEARSTCEGVEKWIWGLGGGAA